MFKTTSTLLVCVLGLGALACAHVHPAGQPSPASPREAIEAASRAFSAAYVRNDPQALGQIYTADALVLPPGREEIRGREEAQRYFIWAPQYRQLAHSMKSSSLDIRGDTAIDAGTWHSTSQRGDNPPATASGAYLVVWVRESDGAWRIKYDMWHRPAPPPKP